jgi:hypothetical protein
MATVFFGLLTWVVMTLLRLATYFLWVGVIFPVAIHSVWLQIIPQLVIVGLYSYRLVKMFYLEKPRHWLAVSLLWTIFTLVFEVGGFHYLVNVGTEALLINLVAVAESMWALTYLLYAVTPIAAYLVYRNTTKDKLPTASF